MRGSRPALGVAVESEEDDTVQRIAVLGDLGPVLNAVVVAVRVLPVFNKVVVGIAGRLVGICPAVVVIVSVGGPNAVDRDGCVGFVDGIEAQSGDGFSDPVGMG